MIHHWAALDLEITDFEYQYDRTLSGKIMPSQTSRYFICEYYFLCDRSESKKAKLEELSNNISERRGLPSR